MTLNIMLDTIWSDHILVDQRDFFLIDLTIIVHIYFFLLLNLNTLIKKQYKALLISMPHFPGLKLC